MATFVEGKNSGTGREVGHNIFRDFSLEFQIWLYVCQMQASSQVRQESVIRLMTQVKTFVCFLCNLLKTLTLLHC